jgi:hypothetical protein
MAVTHVSSLSVGGVPTLGVGGLLTQGKVFFVDPELGVDGNDGSAENPLQSITAAYALCVSGRGDVVVLKGGPTSAGTTGHTARLSSTLTWAKHNTHLIGMAAPTMVGGRSRITGPSSGGTFSPLITVSGSGCRFENLTIFDDYTVDPVALNVTGDRNYFHNVNVQGMGAATGGDDAAAASVKLDGGDENTFVGCMIGLDTIARSTTNAEVELVGAATRNIFIDCFFSAFADNAGHLFVKIDGSGDIDRYVWFRNCFFYNAVESTATTMTQAMDVHNSCGGMVILQDCAGVGFTDWAAADNGNVFISNAAPTAGTSGLAVAVTR